MKNGLTPKQKRFCDNYIKNGGNARRAAIDAGYSPKTAKNATKSLVENDGVSVYIAKKTALLEKKNGTDDISLADIQAFRVRIMKGEEKDAFGLDAVLQDRMKAADSLEKTLRIKEEVEAKKKAAEEALLAKEYHLDLDNIPDVYHPTIRDIRGHKHLEYSFPSGRGTTKSSTIPQIIIELMKNNHTIHAVAVRKVGNTLKDSVYAKFKWAISKMELEDQFECKLSPLEITYKPTNQKIYFRGADDPDKIKSIAPEFGYIGILWFEELDQFSGPEEIRNIEQSAIRGGDLAWVFESFNTPKSNSNWANVYVAEPKENRIVTHASYLDVPREWLGQPFIDEAEHLKSINPPAYEHEYMGVANGTGGTVFEYLELRTITDEEIANMDRIYEGVDWGYFPDYYAFTRMYYNPAEEKIYLIDENCVNKASNRDTAQWILEHNYVDDLQYGIICDSAENKSIADYKDLGIWCAKGAYKPPESVVYGMKWLQKRTFVIDRRRTPQCYYEITKYEYDVDKNGNFISAYPDKDNHCIDSIRYALSPVWQRRQSQA
jgi:PBSX family phage terminase large subunit